MLRKLYSDNGYKLFRMSRFEEYDFYADKKDFLSSKSILTFTNPDGRLMALRPDVTLSLIKHAGNGKYYYNENVYRVPRTSSSFREISQ
ncbi:MAG: ATP phosphoribosyltransferase regulatory subunit, partial [Synergistaceae bacterium]|nr:ATP phosphoribosyltransferase regulatory subunit [Synergistaceae bacterium]